MFGKLGAYLDLFRKGSEVSDPEKWKFHQITGTMVAGVLIALLNLAKSYGYDLPISTDDINQLGVGIIAVANIVLTCTTSKKAGLLPAKLQPATMPSEVPASTAISEVQPVSEPDLQPGPGQDISKDIYIG